MSLVGKVSRHVLSNGFTVLIERDATAPVVAAVSHVRAGYFDEPDEWVGIAHVLEHMFFKGSASLEPGDLARETQLLGGHLNAVTTYDKTVYYAELPASPGSLEGVVKLQADALMRPSLHPDQLAREIEVVVQEANRKLDSPSAVAGETLYQLLFDRHRIRRWRIGTEGGLRTLTADDLRAYHRTRYTPDRTILALVGDLDVDCALELSESVYGGWRTDPAHSEDPPAEEEPALPRLQVLHGDVERPMAVMGWRTVDALHEDGAALDVAAVALGRGRGSWLNRGVRLPGVASGAQSYHYTTPEVGVFHVTIQGDDAKLDDAIERSLDLVEKLREDGPSDVDIERVRALSAVQWSQRLESMDGRATLWAECEALGGVELADRFYETTMAVTAADVRRVADAYLNTATGSAVISADSAFEPRVERAGWPPVTQNTKTPLEIYSISAMSSDPGPPPPRSVERIGDVQVVRMSGVDVLVCNKPGTGLAHIGLYVPDLRQQETEATAGVSALLTRAAVRGAAGMNGEQLAFRAELLGGSVLPVVSSDIVGWTITVRAEAIQSGANLLHAIASQATLDSRELQIERALLQSDAARQRDDMFGYPVRRVFGEAFPGSHYGLSAIGTPESIAAIGDESVREWLRELRGRRVVVVAVGDLSTSELVDGLREFEAWPAVPRREHSKEGGVAWAPGRGQESRDKAQTAIAMAFQCSPYSSPDRFPLIVMGSLLTGLAGRLFVELRERRSLAYTVVAMPWLKRDAGAVLAYIATSASREEEAREAMLDVLRGLGASDIPAGELERARSHAAGAVKLRIQSGRAVSADMLEAWIHGELESLPKLADNLLNVQEEEVRRVAAEAFESLERAEFVVRGLEGDR